MQNTGPVTQPTSPPSNSDDKSPRGMKRKAEIVSEKIFKMPLLINKKRKIAVNNLHKKRKREKTNGTKEKKKQKIENTQAQKSDCKALECSSCIKFRIGTVFDIKVSKEPVVNFWDVYYEYSDEQWRSESQLKYNRECRELPVYKITIDEIKRQSPNLTRLDFETCTLQEDACKRLFTTMPTLEQLVFNKVNLPWIDTFPKKANFSALKILHFWNCENLSHNLFVPLCEDLQPVLRKLNIINTPLNEDSLLKGIKYLTNLRKFVLTHNPYVTGEFFKALRSMNQLRTLKLVDLPNLQPGFFKLISHLPKLFSVEVPSLQFLHIALNHITKLPKLKRLLIRSFDSISKEEWEKSKPILEKAKIKQLVVDTDDPNLIKNLQKQFSNTKISHLSNTLTAK